MTELTPSARSALRARAHRLEPVVLMGGKGLTEAVIGEIDRALEAHELIKVRSQAERGDRETLMEEICSRTGALAVQHIGRVLVLYREKLPQKAAAEERKAAVRKAKARTKPERKPTRKPGERSARGSERPGSRTASPRRAPERQPRRRRTSR